MQAQTPEFEVEVLEGKEEITRNFFDDGKFTQVKETVPKGWMVYFPAGHSIRIRTKQEMRRLGFDRAPNIVDMLEDAEKGEEPLANTSLKENTRRKTKSRRSASTSGIMKDG